MNATRQRDQVITLAKSDTALALALAREIIDPWFRAQALCWVTRFSASNTLAIASEAARASLECDDSYKEIGSSGLADRRFSGAKLPKGRWDMLERGTGDR